MTSETVNVRYMVSDVEAAVAWYTQHLGFKVLSTHAPAFADVQRGALRLLLSGPASSAGRPMPDGAQPAAGGGTVFTSSSTIFQPKSRDCGLEASSSGTNP